MAVGSRPDPIPRDDVFLAMRAGCTSTPSAFGDVHRGEKLYARRRMNPPTSASPRAMRFLVALVGFLALGPSLFGGLVWDDRALLLGNANIREPSSLLELVSTPFWAQRIADGGSLESLYTLPHRPFVKLVFHFGMALGAAGPFALHLFELALHLSCALLVLDLVAKRLSTEAGSRLVVATSLALVFTVHPTRVESVAWICGVTDVAMTFFVLVGMRILHDSTSAPRLVAAALAFALAGWSKEIAVLVPLVVAADSFSRSRPSRDVARATAAALAGVALVSLTWWLSVGRSAHPGPETIGGQVGARVLATWGTFVERVVWPSPATIYPGLVSLDRHGAMRLPPFAILLGAIVMLTTLVAVVRSPRRARARAMLGGLALFLVPLLPVSNFVMRDPRALACDRFLYLPLVGVLVLLAEPMAKAIERFRPPRALVMGGVAAVVLACSLETLASSERFIDDVALYAHEVRLHPENVDASASLMRAYGGRGELGRAARVGEAAIRVARARNDVPALLAIAFPYLEVERARLHDRDRAELLSLRATYDTLAQSDLLRIENSRLSIAVHVGARNAERARGSRVDFAIPRAILHGRTGDVDGAVEQLRALVRAAPERRDAYDVLAIHEARRGEFDAALRTLAEAARRFPNVRSFAEARELVVRCRNVAATPVSEAVLVPVRDANLQLLLGSPGSARALVEPVVRERPDVLLAWLVLAQVEEADGSPERAIARLDEASRALPGNPVVASQRDALLERVARLRASRSAPR